MRILLITQWFQPEPHFKGLPLARSLRDLGHKVEVLTGFPNYPGGKLYPGYRVKTWMREYMDGIPVMRGALYPSHDRSVFKRILNYLSFALSSTLLVLFLRRPDVVYVYCPPMTSAAGAVILKMLRRVPYVIDVQDLWPDTLTSTGMVKEGLMLKLVGAWSTFAMRRADALIVLSSGFKSRLESRSIERPIHVIQNWAPPEIETMVKSAEIKNRRDIKTFNILFAGNIGQAQALDTVIVAAQRLKRERSNIQFTLIGTGVDLDRLRAASIAAKTDNILFLPPRKPSDMASVFSEADGLLVHLRDDPLFSITIPSKTQAYLAIGRPILMGVSGDAAALVKAARAGICFKPEDADSLAEAAIKLSQMTASAREQMGRAGAAFYDEHLSFNKGISKLERVLTSVAKGNNQNTNFI